MTLSHAAMPFAGGAGQAVQEVPHEVRAVLATQAPVPAGQRWNPALQAVPHVLVEHTASALGSDGFAQVAHDAAVPHCRVLSSGKHPLVAGQVWVPAPQATPQAALTQALPVGHAVQSTPSLVPQAFDELLPTQMPLQRWKPVLQPGRRRARARCRSRSRCRGPCRPCTTLPHELMFVLPLTTQVRLAPVPHW